MSVPPITSQAQKQVSVFTACDTGFSLGAKFHDLEIVVPLGARIASSLGAPRPESEAYISSPIRSTLGGLLRGARSSGKGISPSCQRGTAFLDVVR
eukprot:1958958-Rhodomonas_salina.1